MAKLFLESTDTAYKVSNSGTTIYGATGDQTVTIDGSLTGIVLDSNVERVAFSGTTSDYKYKQVGTDLEVYNAAGALVTKFGFDFDKGGKLTFANGTVDAKFAPATGLTVGGQTVSTTAAAAVVPTTIDATVSSAPAPVFSVSAPITSVTEAAGAVASFTVSLNAAQPAATSVAFALGNVGGATTDDYGTAALGAAAGGVTLAGSVLTFAAGSTSAVITVPVTNDSLVETTGDGVSLTLSAPSTGATVGTAAATVSIVDGVPATPTFSLTASATSAAEGTPVNGATAAVASGTITLTVTRAGALTATDTVAIQSVAGTGVSGATTSDFTAISQTLTFLPNEATKTVTFTPVADSTRETDETLTVSLGSASAGSAISTTGNTVTLTITNDDANLLPVITTPPTTPSAFIADSTAVKGVSFTDGDDNTGFSVTVQATGSSQVSFGNFGNNSSITAKNSANTPMYANETSNTITLSGTKADLNTVLDSLKYTTNSTVPTSEQVVITITDSAGGVATKTLPINIGTSGAIRASQSDSLLGSAGDDQFSLASTATFADLTTADTINGSTGRDKLTLTGVTGVTGPVAGTISNVEILDLTLTGDSTVTVSATNFGSALDTINLTGDKTLTGTFNVGTTFNYASTTVTNTLTISSLLTASTSSPSTGTTDAITVNLAGGVTLAGITGTGSVVDVLNINSNGTSANIVSALSTLTADATINLGGAQQLSLTLPNQDFGVVNGASATGKLIVNGAAENTPAAGVQFAIIGGSAGDALTGGAVATSITGNAGNDTIIGGVGVDTITGGTGVDSLTGGAGNDVFVFATGDSPAATRDTIADLAEGDIIKFGTALTGLTNGATLTTSSTNTIYVDNVNNRLVVGTDSINIPPSVANAAFTYSYGADSVVGTADDTITVGAAPFTAINNALGKLTLTGKAIATSPVVIGDINAPTVGNAPVGNNAVRTVDASTVTNAGVSVTGSNGADTITFAATNGAVDTFKQAAVAASGTFAQGSGATNSVSTTAFDVINNFKAGDVIALAAYTGTAAGTAANQVLVNAVNSGTDTVATTSGATLADNKVTVIHGTYNATAGTFVGAAYNATTAADLLVAYDGNAETSVQAYEAIVLVGAGALTASVTAGTDGLLAFS